MYKTQIKYKEELIMAKSKIITDMDYKPRDKANERKTGKNGGGFIDLTPKNKKPRGK
jgi:hypothetical protein